MCGIAGFCDFRKRTKKDTLIEMTDVLYHRGPDDSGYSYYETEFATVGLGHRRLSILDLTSRGHQPMSFQNLEIVYNGEVYNFSEIAKKLEKYGYKFESHSDTEVILKAYDQWSIQAVHKFIGMFAIVIYDKQAKKLVLIRDRAGVKPLYYYFKDGLFLFASELKSFHKHPEFSKDINIDALALFFQFGYIPQPYSIFNNVHKLPAGHYAELNLVTKEFKIYKYWDVIDCYNKPKLKISFEEAKEETEKLLKSACEYRMISDVPVGVFLSGGYDSSAVTAILQKDRSEKLKTFSIGFYEEKYNEAHHARKVAEYLGTDHTEYYCTQKEAKELLPLICEIWDEPFGDPSTIPTTLVSRLARQKVKVSLSADGGDEIFGGYDKYTAIPKLKKVFYSKWFSRILAAVLEKVNPKYLIGINRTYNFEIRYEKIKNILKSSNVNDLASVMAYLSSYFMPNEINKIISMDINSKGYFENEFSINEHNDEINKMLAIDYKTYLVDDILAKVDRATMSTSLEGREPLLDHRIIEFVSGLPGDFKIKNGNKKYLLKQIVHSYIPKEIMERPKMGFGIPLGDWLSNELKEYVMYYLDSSIIKRIGVFNMDELEKIKKIWETRKSNIYKIWLLLVFAMWYERWIE